MLRRYRQRERYALVTFKQSRCCPLSASPGQYDISMRREGNKDVHFMFNTTTGPFERKTCRGAQKSKWKGYASFLPCLFYLLKSVTQKAIIVCRVKAGVIHYSLSRGGH